MDKNDSRYSQETTIELSGSQKLNILLDKRNKIELEIFNLEVELQQAQQSLAEAKRFHGICQKNLHQYLFGSNPITCCGGDE